MREIKRYLLVTNGPSGQAVSGEDDLRPIDCWDCGFESRRRHIHLSLLRITYYQVEVFATGRSLVQRHSTDCGV